LVPVAVTRISDDRVVIAVDPHQASWTAAAVDGSPQPLFVHKQFPVGGPDGKGIYKPVLLDPEDPDYTEPVVEPERRRMQLDFSR
jgi:hypothetical protein